jgi:hypothetical protein
MKGRQSGRPTKWVQASVRETVFIGKAGIRFEVWQKWKKVDRKLGTMIVSVGGIRWRPMNGKLSRRRSWSGLAEWFKDG